MAQSSPTYLETLALHSLWGDFASFLLMSHFLNLVIISREKAISLFLLLPLVKCGYASSYFPELTGRVRELIKSKASVLSLGISQRGCHRLRQLESPFSLFSVLPLFLF